MTDRGQAQLVFDWCWRLFGGFCLVHGAEGPLYEAVRRTIHLESGPTTAKPSPCCESTELVKVASGLHEDQCHTDVSLLGTGSSSLRG